MPRYIMSVEVSAGTPEDSAVTDTVEVEQRVIEEAFIFLDQGSKDFVRGEIRFGDRRVHPHPNSEPARIPGVTDSSPVGIRLPGVPNQLRLRAWAPNSNNPHDVVAVVDMRSVERDPQPVRLVGAGRPDEGPDEPPAPEDIRSAGSDG